MKTFALAVAAVAIVLLFAACTRRTTGAAVAAPVPSGAPPTTVLQAPPSSGSPATNERGAVPKRLGEAAGWTDASGKTQVTFSIDRITVDPECDEFGTKPHGHALVLDIQIATGTDREAIDLLPGMINPYAFQVIGPDGVTEPAEPGSCKAASLATLPSAYGPNQRYRGQVELDVPDQHGTLSLSWPGPAPLTAWEWQF